MYKIIIIDLEEDEVDRIYTTEGYAVIYKDFGTDNYEFTTAVCSKEEIYDASKELIEFITDRDEEVYDDNNQPITGFKKLAMQAEKRKKNLKLLIEKNYVNEQI